MRLDKFLQTSRLIKRRVIAQKLCQAGRVLVNDQRAKPGKTLAIGDRITLNFGSGGVFICEVIALPKGAVRKEQAASLYRVVEDTRSGPSEDGLG